MPVNTPSTRLFIDPLTALTDSAPLSTQISAFTSTNPNDFIGDTLQTAHNIGDLNGRVFSWSDSVSRTDTVDLYRFKMDSFATVEVTLKGLSADADLYILDSRGRTISQSLASGSRDEFLGNGSLDAGIYYLQVKSFFSITNYDLKITVGGISRDPGASIDMARDLGNISRATSTTFDTVGMAADSIDYYRFELSESTNFSLNLSELNSDIDAVLYDRNGQSLATSNRYGNDAESIAMNLNVGTYYVRIYPWSGSSSYSLRVTGTTGKITTEGRSFVGTLGADTFSLTANNLIAPQTIVSGNGNVDFGQNRWDLLDLSSLRSTDIILNLATATTGGMLYDSGNGSRLFDEIRLSNGNSILFEGIDRIQFADRTYTLAISPNDPYFTGQWNLHMMGVQNAWRFGTGSSDVLIGIQDTGLGISITGQIDEDLRSPTYFDVNNIADEFFREIQDDNYGPRYTSHGTLVQSVISAISNNNVGMSGINWNSPVYAIDVLDGNANDLSLAAATQAMISQAIEAGQRLVINMSLGGGSIAPAFRALVANNQDNALFVIASGNSDLDALGNPASLAIEFRNVVAVGASWGRTDRNGYAATPGDRISYPRSEPGFWGSNYGLGLTLMAPSEVIAARTDYNDISGAIFGYEEKFDGTSAAAPNAAGVASLVWSANPNLTAVQVQQILSQTATDLGTAGYDNLTGHGMVNADAAVRRALAIGRGATA